MAYLEKMEELKGAELLVKLFYFVQKIPYRITSFDSRVRACGESVGIGLKRGDCRHKSLLLYNLLMERNFDVDKVKVIFDWKDLPLPSEVLGILEKSGTRMSRDVLRVRVNPRYCVYVDPTWNFDMGEIGFPVTGDWEGTSPTAQASCEDLEYFNAEGFSDEDVGIVLDADEMKRFGEALNSWLDRICPVR